MPVQLQKVYFKLLSIILTICFTGSVQAQSPVNETTGFAWYVEPAYGYRSDGKPGRAISLLLKERSYKGPVTVTVTCNSITETTILSKTDTLNHFRLFLPAGAGVDTLTTAAITITEGDKKYSATLFVPRKKQWTVYIYPHSHLDIGYTALPDEVKKIHLRNIDVGIDIAEKTQNNPEGSRFIWNPEAAWVVQQYLEQASAGQKQKFIAAVKKGWLQLDAGHSNSNLSTFSDEEMIHFFHDASSVEKITGQHITTMVQVDVPGAPWGLVTGASQFGITGFISFPNNFDLRKYHEHKPFYWLGPDGKTKLLFLQGFPYGIGYTIKGSKYGLDKLQTFSNDYDRVSTRAPLINFLNPFIFEETGKLEDDRSPYDLFAMTWSMADNCVIDADLPDAVLQWNKIYAYPKLVIAGAKQILDAFEKKYAAVIPCYRGDFTEFWTNGLGSDAASVGVGRKAKEELVQAELLSIMLHSNEKSATKNEEAWEDQLLSAEHTWGAQNSESLLAQQVEKIKSGYFINSKTKSEELIAGATSSFKDTSSPCFSVINTLSWERNGIITLTKAQSRFGDAVADENNRPVLSQRLSTGELIFLAEQIPALGSKLYKVVRGKPKPGHELTATGSSLANNMFSLQVDDRTGNITSLKSFKNSYEYVDSSAGLNSYQYVTGVYNGQNYPKIPAAVSNVSVSIKEKGPLMVSLLVKSDAEGVTELHREIRLYQQLPIVELINTFNKTATRNKEAIHFGFGFRLLGATGHIEMPWSIVSPNSDQLAGANKNWFAFQRWVDISTKEHGITWSAIESPLIEWAGLSGNILDGARQYSLWQKQVPASSVIYSWPLNNHWDTNFPLEQGGIIQQQYSFTITDGYDVVAANRFGMEAQRPLIVVQTKKNIISKPLIQINNPRLVISTMKKTIDNKAVLLRVKSISDKTETLMLDWPAGKPNKLIECTAGEEPLQGKRKMLEIVPYGVINLRVIF